MLLFWKTVVCEMYSERGGSREGEKKGETSSLAVRLVKECTQITIVRKGKRKEWQAAHKGRVRECWGSKGNSCFFSSMEIK